ncbi:MAG: radical SAM protein [Thermoflexales bacterium]|nr:radical SAM protein [Thermoflexales bacterium]
MFGKVLSNYFTNLWRLLRGSRLPDPLAVSYCITTCCNLACAYCEDFGRQRNAEQSPPLSLTDARRLLAIIRRATGSLIFTGGEPLLYPDIQALVTYARRELHFKHLSLITNGLLLAEQAGLLGELDRLVVSLDSVDPGTWHQTLGVEADVARRILKAVAATARQQEKLGFQMAAHCVVMPDALGAALNVLDFCVAHGILFSFSPQAVNNWPHYELLASNAYRSFVSHVIDLKLGGAPILGSMAYLKSMLTFEPFACYPLLVPRVMPDGGLVYPCRPIERGGDAHGGRDVNLLEAGDWQVAVERAVARYGLPPLTCGSCYQQCYAEPSLMQARPLALLRELVVFAPSRRGRIHDYAPG